MSDPYNLERFVTAQDDGGTYAQALKELPLWVFHGEVLPTARKTTPQGPVR